MYFLHVVVYAAWNSTLLSGLNLDYYIFLNSHYFLFILQRVSPSKSILHMSFALVFILFCVSAAVIKNLKPSYYVNLLFM